MLHPGLRMLHTVKLGCCPITDFGISILVKIAPSVHHLEVPGCEALTDYGVKQCINKFTKLKYLDLSRVPIVNYKYLDELKNEKPDLLMRRNLISEIEKKDNGLRVPRRVVSKKKKKKKKGGKKKK
jgi:hypothetical protein